MLKILIFSLLLNPILLQPSGRFQYYSNSQLNTLRQIILRQKPDERADLYFRLAESYWSNGLLFKQLLGKKLPKALSHLRNSNLSNLSNQFLRRALHTYSHIEKKFRGYRNYCQTLYFKGKVLQSLSNEYSAYQSFHKLYKTYRYSPAKCSMLAHALFEMGMYNKRNNRFPLAKYYLLKATSLKSYIVSPKSYYNLASIYFHIGQKRKARASMKKAIQMMLKTPKSVWTQKEKQMIRNARVFLSKLR